MRQFPSPPAKTTGRTQSRQGPHLRGAANAEGLPAAARLGYAEGAPPAVAGAPITHSFSYPVNLPLATTPVDRLGASLLRLGRLARDVAAPDFLGAAVDVVREQVPFHSGWWGLGSDNGEGEIPAIHQVGLLDLPDSFAADWANVAVQDSTLDHLRQQLGQVVNYRHDDALATPPEIVEFDRRYGIAHGMALALDTTGTGHMFFISVFRSAAEPPFSDDEGTLFRHLMHNVVQLWHFCLQDALSASLRRGAARLADAMASSPAAGAASPFEGLRTASAALARADGRLLYAGPEVCALFYAQWPDWEGVDLPDPIVAQLGLAPCTVQLRDGALSLLMKDGHVWLMLTGKGPAPAASPLSPRERRVALQFAAGQSYKEIARALNLAPATVRTYLRDAYLRLGVKNKIQLGEVLKDG